MHKVYDPQTYANVFYPDSIQREQLSVSEIGLAEPPEGNEIKIDRSVSSIIHYVVSGSCYFKDSVIQSPTIIVTRPGESLDLRVCEDCNCFQVFWIKCCGDMTGELLSASGLYSDVRVLPFDYVDKALKLFEKLTSEASYKDEDDGLYLMGALFRLLSLNSAVHPPKSSAPISPYTQTILKYIHKNYGIHISENILATLVNLSTNYMHKIFLSDMKMTPIYYLNSYRIKQAKNLLKDTALPISAIADEVGISGGDYFCRVFRKYNNGISPTEYRKRIKQQAFNH